MYYHYTNRHGAMAIHMSKYIQPSGQSGAFGPGVYLTDLDPCDFFREEILINNYGGIKSGFHNRADWVIEVTENDIDMQLLRKVHIPGETDRRIFVYPYAILVGHHQIYDKPRCFRSYDESDENSSDVHSDGESGCNEDDGLNYESEDGESGNYASVDDKSGRDFRGNDENESDESGDDESQSDASGDAESQSDASGDDESGNDESVDDYDGDDYFIL